MGEIIAPKYVELFGIINQPLMLHLVGYLCYLGQDNAQLRMRETDLFAHCEV